MFITRTSLATLLLSALALPATLHAQSLADLVTTADENRPGTMPAKVYADKDLAGALPPPVATTLAGAPPAPAPIPMPAEVTDAEARGKPESWWRARMRTLRDRLGRDQPPATTGASNVARLLALVRTVRGAALATMFVELTQAEKEQRRLDGAVAADNRLMDSTEAMARRLGISPGWLRP